MNARLAAIRDAFASAGRWLGARRHSLGLTLTAVACAAGAYQLSERYLAARLDEQTRQLAVQEATVAVVVPSRPMQVGEQVSSADLQIRQIPARYVDSQSVLEATYPAAIGQTLISSIDQGRPLLWAHLDGIRPRTFSGHVPEGLRALTVQVDEVNALSGFLQPGDRVDLMLSLSDRQGPTIRPLMQNLEVLATGQSTEPLARGDAISQGRFSTITVQVSPTDAQRITLAQSLGRLTAVLRNPEDTEPSSTDIMNADALFGAEPETPPAVVSLSDGAASDPSARPPRRPRRPRIEYIIGGS